MAYFELPERFGVMAADVTDRPRSVEDLVALRLLHERKQIAA
jgi:hypothetical protein